MEFEHKVGALDDEDLVVGERDEKNWKGIVISLLVIGSIMGAIVIAIILCTPNGDIDANRMKLELDHVVSDAYKAQEFTGTWLSEHEIVYVDQNGSIVVFDANLNRSSSILVKTHDKTLHTMGGFKLSPDRQHILFVSDVRHEFGERVSARYAIFNVSSQTVDFLDDLIKSHYPSKQPQIMWANWGAEKDSIVVIESNDIYVMRDFGRRPVGVPSNYLRLTKTGAYSDSKRNGLPDSLYRANIFRAQPEEAALWWSPDGHYLAYLSFDDAEVSQIPIEHYDNYMHETDTYPKIHYERYPRAGGLNPTVSVHVVELFKSASQSSSSSSNSNGDATASESNSVNDDLANSPSSGEFEASIIGAPTELLRQQQQDPRMGHYVTYVGWMDARQLVVMWANRAQNSSYLSICSNSRQPATPPSIFGASRAAAAGGSVATGSWKCDIMSSFMHRLPPSIDARQTILTSVDSQGQRLTFFALPRPDSAIGDHYHVALLRGDERAPKYLTYGPFDVDRLVAYDAVSDSLYFEVKISERAERHLYRLSPIGQVHARQTTCLTCQLSDEACGYNQVHMPPGSPIRYMVHECLGPQVPVTRMRRLLMDANGGDGNGTGSVLGTALEFDPKLTSMQVLASDKQLEGLVKSKLMPIEKYMTIKANGQFPFDVNVKLYLPNESEEEKDKRFPMLVESSEIDRRNVWKKFDLDWGKYLASRKQLVYAKIDSIKSGPTILPTASGEHQLKGSIGGQLSPGLMRQHLDPAALDPSLATGGAGSAQWHRSQGESVSSSSFGQETSDELEWPLINAKVQMDVIKFLADSSDLFPYIDKRRIAIWGPTSTASYVALATTMNDETKIVQCTIAMSPITNWRYMYSYAAEHYFGLPWVDSNTNMKYERSNLLKKTSEFAMRKLLVLHGTSDEQVHVQNSLQFIKSLTEHHIVGGVIHQMQLYPDTGHSFEPVKRHLYLTLDGFVDRCFYQKPITIKATEWKGKVRPKLY